MIHPSLSFTEAESDYANRACGANCGPHSLAAATGVSVLMACKVLKGFLDKGYTNPTMMEGGLKEIGRPYDRIKGLKTQEMPVNGIARIQWEGKWLKPGVPSSVAYGYTHWVAARDGYVLCTACPWFGWMGYDIWKSGVDCLCAENNFSGWHATHHYLLK